MLVGPISHKGGSGYIDDEGGVRIPFEFEELGSFSEGVAWFVREGKIGFIDEVGEIVIPAVFDRGNRLMVNSDFHSGLAVAQSGSKHGYINRSGSFAIPCRFQTCSRFVSDIALAQDELGFAVMHLSGQCICRLSFSDVAEAPYEPDLIKVYPRIEGTSVPAFVNRYGTIVAGPFTCFQEVFAFSSSAPSYAVARCRKSGLTGFIDRDWKVQIPFRYGNAGDFNEGLAAACTRDYLWGYIDPAGEWVIQPGFADARNFYKGTAAVKRGRGKAGKWLIIDRSSQAISPGVYDDVLDYGDGFRCVLVGKSTMVVDPNCRSIWSADS